MAESDYTFVSDGIGRVLNKNLLKVPLNQRPYAWKELNVRQLMDDVNQAMTENVESYFLGTIVLVGGEDDRKLIADGQQRIATTSILLARCRDLLKSYGELRDATSVETDFLKRYVRDSGEDEFLLTMNVEDDGYFRSIIIEPDWIANRPLSQDTTFPSNERLYAASQFILLYLQHEVQHLNSELAVTTLKRWVTFFEKHASVVSVSVPDEVGAFRMFETLNDRGLRASQADILKNYFFSKVKQHELDQIQTHWTQIYSALSETFDDPDDQMIKYIKYFWVLENGLTRDRELAKNITAKIRNGPASLDFVRQAREAIDDYVAIFNSESHRWSGYGSDFSSNLRTLTNVIGIEQIVPLLFAVVNKFSVVEAKKAVKLFVSWSVRFILGGSGRAGRLDKQYADLAQDVGTGKRTAARELRDFLADKVPSDTVFSRAVESAKVSSAVLARYYLICLEVAMNSGTGELEPSRDVTRVNLEHILPKKFSLELGVEKADHDDLLTRLGNQTVMQSEWNKDLGNLPFQQKTSTYARSAIGLTNELGKLGQFRREEIDERQRRMAKVAPAIWTLKLS